MSPDTPENRVIPSPFRPARWLRNRHAQTVMPSLPWAWRRKPELRREVLRLPDGDETAVDWVVTTGGNAQDRTIAGNSARPGKLGRPLHMRACSWRLQPKGSGGAACCTSVIAATIAICCLAATTRAKTNDVRFFVEQLEADGQFGPIVAAGYSLGGNVLLKYLGESGDDCPLRGAAAVCVPFNLHLCAEALNNGLSKGYQHYLLKRMKSSVTEKFDRPHSGVRLGPGDERQDFRRI